MTEKAGVGAEGLFGMGVAVGDYDNDGYPDLFVLGYGRCILYHNNGDGTFTDVTARAGVANTGRWASSAAWFDYDNDGRLGILLVANLTSIGRRRPITTAAVKARECAAIAIRTTTTVSRQRLYHNNGDGSFTDVSKSSGLAANPANGLGVVTFDFDDDGWQDIFIANDSQPNSLFRNNRDGTFREVAYEAGVAVSEDGVFEAGMGVDAADMSGSGRLDLVVAHLDLQLARFYRNQGNGSFTDATSASKLSYETFRFSVSSACDVSITTTMAGETFSWPTATFWTTSRNTTKERHMPSPN